jgi:cytidyltransferase-like protein
MADRRIALVSGYFNPLHVGHLRMIRAARDLAGYLIVIVNNDEQQLLKKGRVIQTLADRIEIVRALRPVDEVVAAIDTDQTVVKTLTQIRSSHRDARLIFANGGDRSDPQSVAEYETCGSLSIELAFGVGGVEKADSSSRIHRVLGPD